MYIMGVFDLDELEEAKYFFYLNARAEAGNILNLFSQAFDIILFVCVLMFLFMLFRFGSAWSSDKSTLLKNKYNFQHTYIF